MDIIDVIKKNSKWLYTLLTILLAGVVIQWQFEGFVNFGSILKFKSDLPVGTVVVSILPWEKFADEVGDNPTTYNSEKNSWAPCDARTISGSKLAPLVDSANTPDFRGIFLRGLNQFATDQRMSVPDEQKDPDNRTQAGEPQGSQVGGHEHVYEGNGADGGVSVGEDDDHRNVWMGGDYSQNQSRNTTSRLKGETRPVNRSVYYYIKIN